MPLSGLLTKTENSFGLGLLHECCVKCVNLKEEYG